MMILRDQRLRSNTNKDTIKPKILTARQMVYLKIINQGLPSGGNKKIKNKMLYPKKTMDNNEAIVRPADLLLLISPLY